MILAAGDGGRLGRHTELVPKPLIPVSGRPLIEYTLDALAECDVAEAVLVTGYRAPQLRVEVLAGGREFPAIRFVSNPRFGQGASLSLRAARDIAGAEPFLLLMADHLLSAPILLALIEAWEDGGPSLVATDASSWPLPYIEEATRVRLAPGSSEVNAIGKALEPWDALDTGAFLVAPEAWAAVDASPEDCELSVIFTELARRGRLRSVDVSGASWYDVDTVADLEAAKRMLAAGGAR